MAVKVTKKEAEEIANQLMELYNPMDADEIEGLANLLAQYVLKVESV